MSCALTNYETGRIIKVNNKYLGRVYIYGAGIRGKKACEIIEKNLGGEVIAFLDSDSSKWGCEVEGYSVINPCILNNVNYDKIVIAVRDIYQDEVKGTLDTLGVNDERIVYLFEDLEYMDWFADQRTRFIDGFARWVNENNIKGSVAECGVNKGDSARFINRAFKDRQLFLFDTFDGFTDEDLCAEDELNNPLWRRERFDSCSSREIYRNISIEYILSRMPYRDRVIVKKGYFPATYENISDRFCFVNLDMDLYKPTLAALRVFWDLMEKGGAILLHDYYEKDLGVKAAVTAFECEIGYQLTKMPIGDDCSIVIIK